MKKISTRICVIFATIMVIVTMIISGLLVGVFGKMMRRQLMDAQRTLLEQNKVNVQNMLNGLNQVSVYLTSDNVIADVLNDTDPDELAQYTNREKLLQEFSRYVNGPLSDRLSTYSASLYIFDYFEVTKGLESRPLGERRQRLSAVYGASAVENDEWFQNTIKKNGSIYTFTEPDEESKVYASRLIRNIHIARRDEQVGVMVVALSREQFARQVEMSNLTPNAEVYIIDPATQVVLYASNKTGRDSESIVNKFGVSPGLYNGEVMEIEGKHYLFMCYSTYWNWNVLSLIPMSDISSQLWSGIPGAIIAAFICLSAGIVIIFGVSQSISRPLTALSRHMAQMEESDAVESILPNSKRKDEVGRLYQSFDRLMNRIRILLQKQYESGVRQKETELLALQAQINPHFVYNVLDSMNWLALCNGNDDMVEISSSFAEIMRYSIRKPYEKVTLQDEIFHVENYMRIQQKQSQAVVHVTEMIPPEHLCVQMPKFLVEPLVENCVIHGFAGGIEGGEIVISTVRADDVFIISVADNGIGADVDSLNQYIEGKITGLAHSDGFGIKNVNDRIHLMYSGLYGLFYRANEGKGITAQIRIPYLLAEPEEEV